MKNKGVLIMVQGLHERLYMSRINSKLSRKQVSTLLNVSESLIGLYETATRQPSLENLMKLASIYKVTTDYLLGCEPAQYDTISLYGLNNKQIEALTLTVKCFRNQNIGE